MTEHAAGDVCAACGKALQPGSEVLQVVRGRHPTYDREVVLSTYHVECWEGRESQFVTCTHCGCTFRLVLVGKGDDYQNLARKLFCPFCGTMFQSQMGF